MRREKRGRGRMPALSGSGQSGRVEVLVPIDGKVEAAMTALAFRTVSSVKFEK